MNLEEARNNIGAEVELDESTKPYTFVIDGIVMYDDIPIYGTLTISDIDEDDGNVGFTNENGTTDWYLPKHLKLKPQSYKIHVPTEEESREAQELFFELGYDWLDRRKYIQYTDMPYIYTHSDKMKITMSWAEEKFDSHKNKQITIQDLRDMVAKKKLESKCFDEVVGSKPLLKVKVECKEMTWQDALRAVADGKKLEVLDIHNQWENVKEFYLHEIMEKGNKFRLAPQRITLNGEYTKEELLQKAVEME